MKKLYENRIEGEVSGRLKQIYSIYQKMRDQNIDFGQVYDITAYRVVVNSLKDCYDVLGIIHSIWKPIPGKFKDYIGLPKENMYQSLHTSVIGPAGVPYRFPNTSAHSSSSPSALIRSNSRSEMNT